MGILGYVKEKIEHKKETKISRDKRQTLLEQLGLDNSASQEQFFSALIKYAKKDNLILDDIILTDDEKNDLSLMMQLYKCQNSKFNLRYRPDTQDNKYVMKYLRELYFSIEQQTNHEPYFKHIIKGYEDRLTDPKFVEGLINTFPNLNILEIVYQEIVGYASKAKTTQYNTIIENIPTHILSQQAKSFGKDFLYRLPKEHKDYITLVNNAIACDDFDSLATLQPETLLENRHLIINAFEASKENETLNYKKVKHYFNGVLSPLQRVPLAYEDNAQPKYVFSKPHLVATYEIANDTKLWSKIDIPDSMKESIIKSMQRTLNYYPSPYEIQDQQTL